MGGISVGPSSYEYSHGHLDPSGETVGVCRIFPTSEAGVVV